MLDDHDRKTDFRRQRFQQLDAGFQPARGSTDTDDGKCRHFARRHSIARPVERRELPGGQWGSAVGRRNGGLAMAGWRRGLRRQVAGVRVFWGLFLRQVWLARCCVRKGARWSALPALRNAQQRPILASRSV